MLTFKQHDIMLTFKQHNTSGRQGRCSTASLQQSKVYIEYRLERCGIHTRLNLSANPVGMLLISPLCLQPDVLNTHCIITYRSRTALFIVFDRYCDSLAYLWYQ